MFLEENAPSLRSNVLSLGKGPNSLRKHVF